MQDEESRRKFLVYATSAMGVAGLGAAVWTLASSLKPGADTLNAGEKTVVKIDDIPEGKWRMVRWNW
ncbi:MAG: hypothetical protein CMM52_11040 [Rhodospirillaceae bacterium]|nr:hypothetical protein [Rhodospirillaceae bacterium]|tara:strand:- start:13289 stop:13489 length:201 start_codon:yes stop_codon:yes gene_type:complete